MKVNDEHHVLNVTNDNYYLLPHAQLASHSSLSQAPPDALLQV